MVRQVADKGIKLVGLVAHKITKCVSFIGM
jgi:hypothetical protein